MDAKRFLGKKVASDAVIKDFKKSAFAGLVEGHSSSRLKSLFRRIALRAMLAVSLMGMSSLANAGSSVEVMAGNSRAELIVKTNVALAKGMNLFVKNRSSVDYKNKVGYFGFADLSYNLIGGLDAVSEMQFASGSALVSRLGLEYFKKFGKFSLFNMGTMYLNRDSNAEFFSSIGYGRNLAKDLDLAIGAENLMNFGSSGFAYGVQRLRAGLGIGRFEFGGAVDLGESSGSSQIYKNIGAYSRVKF